MRKYQKKLPVTIELLIGSCRKEVPLVGTKSVGQILLQIRMEP